MKSIVLGLFWLLCVIAWTGEAAAAEIDEEAQIPISVNYFDYKNEKYGLSMIKLNWFEAQLFCASQDYLLANIHTETDQDEILNFIQAYAVDELPTLANEPIWTSGTNQAVVSQYVWQSSGTRMLYRNFLGTPAGGYRCVGLNGVTGFWTAENCRDRHYFVCQVKNC